MAAVRHSITPQLASNCRQWQGAKKCRKPTVVNSFQIRQTNLETYTESLQQEQQKTQTSAYSSCNLREQAPLAINTQAVPGGTVIVVR